MVVIEIEVEGVEVLEGGEGCHVQGKGHVLEHKVQPHLLQLWEVGFHFHMLVEMILEHL